LGGGGDRPNIAMSDNFVKNLLLGQQKSNECIWYKKLDFICVVGHENGHGAAAGLRKCKKCTFNGHENYPKTSFLPSFELLGFNGTL
jgi:hypothetical protein